MSPEQITDLQDLISSGQARLLRQVSGYQLAAIGWEIGVSGCAIRYWEKGRNFPRATAREKYYNQLCEWRSCYGTVEIAVPEGDCPRLHRQNTFVYGRNGGTVLS